MPGRLAKFGDQKKEKYLRLLRDGQRRGQAARACGVSYETVRLHLHAEPWFAHAVHDAEMDANEVVENALFETAKAGNVLAQQVWLYNRSPDRWKDRRNLQVGGNPEGPPLRLTLEQAVAELVKADHDRVPNANGTAHRPE